MTFLTDPFRWPLARFASVKRPVDSTTICAPVEVQSSFAGSFSANTLMALPSTVIESAVELISFFRLPRMESYFSRWASVAGLVKSLTATTSISGFPSDARNTLRPIRPKPLIPTFTAIEANLLRLEFREYLCTGRAQRLGVRGARGVSGYNPHVAMLAPQSTNFYYGLLMEWLAV